MRLDYGSLGRELWLGFFSVIRQPWTLSSIGTPTSALTFVSTVTHMLLILARVRVLRCLGGQEVMGRLSRGDIGASSSSHYLWATFRN